MLCLPYARFFHQRNKKNKKKLCTCYLLNLWKNFFHQKFQFISDNKVTVRGQTNKQTLWRMSGLIVIVKINSKDIWGGGGVFYSFWRAPSNYIKKISLKVVHCTVLHNFVYVITRSPPKIIQFHPSCSQLYHWYSVTLLQWKNLALIQRFSVTSFYLVTVLQC